MKKLILASALSVNCHAAEIGWNSSPEDNISHYNIWSEEAGVYSLIGISETTSFDLGALQSQINVSISAINNSGEEGDKSDVLVITPTEVAPFVYVSLIGETIYTFATSKDENKEFFRFDLNGDQAVLQSSLDLAAWESGAAIRFVGDFSNPDVRIAFRQ